MASRTKVFAWFHLLSFFPVDTDALRTRQTTPYTRNVGSNLNSPIMRNLIIIIIISIISCQSPKDKNDNARSESLKNLKTSLDSLFNSKIRIDEPGAALLVAYDGEMLISKGYGLRDIKNKESVTPNTNFRMASVSKQFTALSIASLVDKGLLSLNDSLYKFWNYPVFRDITIQQLINHSSGLPDYFEVFMKDWDKTKIVENKDILNWLATNPKLLFKPGDKFVYSNTAYVVLALLVEKISRKEFSAYAKEQVFKKAGMKRTNYFNLAKPIEIKERANCYEKDSLGNWKQVDGFFINGIMGDGSVYTSIYDYFTYDLALRNKTILSDNTHEILFKPSIEVPDNWGGSTILKDNFTFLDTTGIGYGMGWFVTDDLAFHHGGYLGTCTITVRENKRPLTIAIFMNSNNYSTSDELINNSYKIVCKYVKTTANIAYKK